MAIELIVNGGFEEHVPLGAAGWGVFTQSGAIPGWESPDFGIEIQEISGPSGNVAGDAVVELATDRNTTVRQTVTVAEAGDYDFSFSYAMGGTDVATNGIAVTLSINGAVQALAVPQPVIPGYRDFSQVVALAAGDVVTVSFVGTGTDDARGTHIDDVSLMLEEPPPPSSANLIVNGEFEEHVDLGAAGWGILTAAGAVPGWSSPSFGIEVQEVAGPSGNVAGDAVVELATDRNTTVQQTVLISDTGYYDFSFAYALGGTDVATNGISVAVTVDGVSQVLDVDQPTVPGWQTFEDQFFFQADDEVTFSFTGTGIDDARGTHIDSVSLIAASAPPINTPPVAVDDVAETTESQAVVIDVLANDTDAELDRLVIAAFDQPSSGSVTQAGDTLVYTPIAGFTGDDTFRYTISDGAGGSASADVDVTVRAAPPPSSQNLVVNGEFEDHPDLGAAGWGVFAAIPGWTSPSYGIEVQEISGPSGNVAGDAVVELDSTRNTTITQAIVIPDAGVYELSFEYALGGDISTNGFSVTLDTLAGPYTFTPALPTSPGYVSYSAQVSLAAGETVSLSFSGTGFEDGRGTHIDGVSLVRLDNGGPSNTASFFDPFDTLDPVRWGVSDGYTNGFWQSSSWDRDQVRIENGELVITLEADPSQPGRTITGEIFSRELYGYGTYEARVLVPDAPGTVAAMFTYVGPGIVPGELQDEIDFEFLGRNPFAVQTNYFSDGISRGGEFIGFGFDASQTPVDIAFDWSPQALRWYVDGVLEHEVLAGPSTPLPDAPGLIFFDLWSVAGPNLESWAGAVDPAQLPAEMRIDYFAYTAPGDPAQFADSILG